MAGKDYEKFKFDLNKTTGGNNYSDEQAQRTITGEILVTGSKLKLGVRAINPQESGQFVATLFVYIEYGEKMFELDLVDKLPNPINRFTIQHSKQ